MLQSMWLQSWNTTEQLNKNKNKQKPEPNRIPTFQVKRVLSPLHILGTHGHGLTCQVAVKHKLIGGGLKFLSLTNQLYNGATHFLYS